MDESSQSVQADGDGSRRQTVVFVGNGRCYHTMDWFHSAQALRPEHPPVLATELIEGEEFTRLIRPGDRVEKLVVIDGVLFSRQSRLGDIWRNVVKLAMLPLQVLRLRAVLRRYPDPVLHAHSMYYIAMARFAGCPYVGTPQGSEVLSRPFRSRAYRQFARIALEGAARISVDSVAMQRAVEQLYGLRTLLIQNGIDVAAIEKVGAAGRERNNVVSIRGLVPNYQIDRLLEARNATSPGTPVHFCYPFADVSYRPYLAARMCRDDLDLGRLNRMDLYRLLASAKLVISVPLSDSSPRSVYEAIFCGAIVATTDAGWISELPDCMRARLVVVDLTDPDWFAIALRIADERVRRPFVPSSRALELFDQRRSMQKFYDDVYPAVAA